ncbi:hypothetical protein FB566_0498 [Stackebrandtia endophytica]|uniref:Uncharacterized protein n=1 Tax=Stackebrandtia endophytica TaxID=1496996 RepID=A0A543AR52_9ACTN|nr:hypothetical protein [Stackebrandtia endophytica]TQL75006.1 hypothetical protein FB566_0498 [Stackebrandtia endophytica]
MSFSPADLARQSTPVEPADVDTVMESADQALAELDGLAQLPTPEHVAVFEAVQQSLADTLTAVDET